MTDIANVIRQYHGALTSLTSNSSGGLLYGSGTVKIAGQSLSFGLGVTAGGKTFIFGSGGVPPNQIDIWEAPAGSVAQTSVDSPILQQISVSAIFNLVSSYASAKLSVNLGVSNQSLEEFIDYTKPQIQFSGHYAPFGASINDGGFEVSFGSGYAFPSGQIVVQTGIASSTGMFDLLLLAPRV